jgi:hypothetical protein
VKRLPALVLALAAACSIDVSDRLAAATPADWSQVPRGIRRNLHFSVKDLPPYSMKDDSLVDVRRWPAEMAIDGTQYVLVLTAMKGDMLRYVRSISEIDSGWSYGSRYTAYTWDGKSRSRGPAYWWYPNGALSERALRERSGTRTWIFDREGRLRGYMGSNRGSGCVARSARDEFFDTSGLLIAFRGDGRWFWVGQEIDGDEFSRRLSEFYRW